MKISLSPQQLGYVEALISYLQELDMEEPPSEWPYVDQHALIVPDAAMYGLELVRDELLDVLDPQRDDREKGQRKKMVENIIDHIDVAIGRESPVPAGHSVTYSGTMGGRAKTWVIKGPWPPRWGR